MPAQALDLADYTLNPFSVSSLVAAVMVIALGAVLPLREGFSRASVSFLALTVLIGGWLSAFSVMYAADSAGIALWWTRIGLVFVALIPGAAFHFSVVALQRMHIVRRWVIGGWIVSILVAGFVVAAPVVRGMHRLPWGYYPRYGLASVPLLALFGAALFAIGRQHLIALRQTQDETQRIRVHGLVLAFLIGAVSLVDFLPGFGVVIYPFGYLTAFSFTVIATWTIWERRLVGITPEFAAGQILDTMQGAVLVTDLDGVIRLVNRAFCRLLGYSEGELIGRMMREVVRSPLDSREKISAHRSNWNIRDREMAWFTREGKEVIVTVSASIAKDQRGSPAGVVYVAVDLTERKRAEDAMRESEERYRRLVELSPDAILVHSGGKIAFVNSACVKLLGASSPDEIVGRHPLEFVHPDDRAAVQERIREMRDKGSEMRLAEERFVSVAGTTLHVEVAAVPTTYRNAAAVQIVARDIRERKQAEESLRRSEERYRELFENANDIVYTHDLAGRFTSLNKAGERISGYSREEALKLNISDILTDETRPVARRMLEAKIKGDASTTSYELEIVGKGGRVIPLEVSTRLVFEAGRAAGVQGIARDVTERRRAAEALRKSEARYRLLFERNLAGVYRNTLDGRILDCNDACARIFGFASREEFLSRGAVDVYFDPVERQKVLELLTEQGSITNFEECFRRKDGSPVWIIENVSLTEDEGGEKILEGTVIDITERKMAEKRIEHQAFHDAVTGLPNRLLFNDRLSMAIGHAHRAGRPVAVMFLDLDHFKNINDTLGHTVGDELLRSVGERLRHAIREDDTVARLGGDEFTLIVTDLGDERDAVAVAEKVLEAVARPVVVEDHELQVTTSIGISLYPADGTEVDTLVKNADAAMYRAKERGRNNYQLCTPAMNALAMERRQVERDLRGGLDRGEFVIFFQPILHLAGGQICGVEALVRWRHPIRGLLDPADFIPAADEGRLLQYLGEWVMKTACAEVQKWRRSVARELRLSVNFSARQLLHPEAVHVICHALEESGLPADALDAEIPELSAVQSGQTALEVMKKLREIGIGIALDDFGTGRSSIMYLRRFPLTAVKVDRAIVQTIGRSESDRRVVSTLISVAHSFGLTATAEGIETGEQLRFLRQEGCDRGQGFLFCHPLAAPELETKLRAGAFTG